MEQERLSLDQQYALELLHCNRNIFISGKAGTGKSFLIRQYLNEIDRSTTLITAPTGLATQNFSLYQAQTLHSLFRIEPRPLQQTDYAKNRQVCEILDIADQLIIDEISMVRADVFQYIWNTISRYNIRLIVIGDFLQLEPVVTDKDREIFDSFDEEHYPSYYCFETKAWEDCNFLVAELTQNHRQDEKSEQEFVHALYSIREKKDLEKAFDFINANARVETKVNKDTISLCPTNKLADEINNYELNKIEDREIVKIGIIDGYFEKPYPSPEKLKLKRGAKIIVTANAQDLHYVNGTLGTVYEIFDDYVIIDVKGEKITINPYTWNNIEYVVEEITLTEYITNEDGKRIQRPITKKVLNTKNVGSYTQIPLRLAWALTVHKVQGQSFNSIKVYSGFFANGQQYVALSRLTSVYGLYIDKPLKIQECMASERAIAFYTQLHCKKLFVFFTAEQINILLNCAHKCTFVENERLSTRIIYVLDYLLFHTVHLKSIHVKIAYKDELIAIPEEIINFLLNKYHTKNPEFAIEKLIQDNIIDSQHFLMPYRISNGDLPCEH